MTDPPSAALVAATVTTGLAAGLFYSFSCAVMAGLRHVDDRAFVATMSAINVAIRNGWFLVSFAGALLSTATAAALQLTIDPRPALPLVVVALLAYLAMLAITAGVHIPLNNQLHTAAHRGQDHTTARRAFEQRWNRWNLARTLTSTTAFACLVIATTINP